LENCDPIGIGKLERFVADWDLETGKDGNKNYPMKTKEPNGKS